MEYFYNLFIILLVVIGVASFTMFVRRLLINSSVKNRRLEMIEMKLDEMKELLLKEQSK
ncbi:DUF4083 family protein [Paenisporosarcina cavernae]|uniref:DUF4083 domain-containing protein n=1 Tax=Paenisporosarcina cavernae TaxID=2320858 RepID=A0A385YVJ8_9BACL|nr:DUF4083 family protein [Paenisporosarcina cavernae]AYC30501.1 DUF4083 domain-containing protein [Paenisporosarcina cavernae]